MADKMPRLLADGTVTWYFLFAAWSAIFIAMTQQQRARLTERRLAEAETAAHAAQVRALRYQVNPHFLFNTLNSLSALVMSGRADRAEEMLMALSTFFRTSLSLDPSADVTLAQEIDLQRLYLDIEKIRFPHRLRFEIDVPDDLSQITVPALILQPLVENAIKYGVSATRDPIPAVDRRAAPRRRAGADRRHQSPRRGGPNHPSRQSRRMRAPGSALPMSVTGSKRIMATAPIAASAQSPGGIKCPSPFRLPIPMTELLRVLVADDEPLASDRLNLLLARVEGVTLVGSAIDGTEAIELAEQVDPDVVMLDIAMPGLDGIEVARALSRLPRSPAVIFVTAYDQFAVAAFEVAAVDYLMKPVDSTRLDRALERARTFLAQRGPASAPPIARRHAISRNSGRRT